MFVQLSSSVAALVTRHPKLCIIFSILFALLSSLSLLNCTVEKDISRSFSPRNSRSLREGRIYAEFFNLTSPDRGMIIFRAKDGGTILRKAHIDEMYRIDFILRSKIMKSDGQAVRICEPLCDLNAPINIFWKEFIGQNNKSNAIGYDNLTVFDHPTSRIYDHDIFMGMHMFGVRKAEKPFANHSTIIHASKLVVWHFWQTQNAEMKQDLKSTVLEMYEMSKSHNASELIDFDIFTDEIANSEMMKGMFKSTRTMLGGFCLLLTFVFIVVRRKIETRAIPGVLFATLFSPFLAALIAFGILSWLKYPIYSIMSVTPFLILGIGVDDAFIVIQSWVHFRSISNKEERLTRVFFEVGPSVSITSITNTVAFGIGFLTPAPQMSIFCLCTSIACFADYILTFTLFAPILAICNGTTCEYQRAVLPTLGLPKKPKKDWYDWYAGVLCSVNCQIFAFVLLLIMYLFTGYGVLGMKSAFEPGKAFPSDSHVYKALHGIEDVFTEFFPLQLIVSHAPDISNETEYSKFYEMVSELESVPLSYGRDRTQLFLKGYEEFDRKMYHFNRALGMTDTDEYAPSFDNLPFYLQQIKMSPIARMETDKNGHTKLMAFQMALAAHDMREWYDRAIYVARCRSVVEQYPEFNATVHDFDSAILDLILTVKMSMLTSVAVTVVCMAVVCFFFIPNKTGLLVIIFNIASICFTLVGGLAWWGADLDPVTMVDALIAAGFSVDYTAHIAHKFYKATGTAHQRLTKSFKEMCAPMFQAGLSTALCMSPLIFNRTYAVVTFARTTFLVVGFGLFHGLFILPVLLAIFCRKLPDAPLPQEVIPDELEAKNDQLLM